MTLFNWLLADYKLTKKLRAYSVNNVKIAEADQTRSRRLVKDYIEDQIMEYCRQNSPLPISRMEYTGSVYERLKTETSDEVDVMVVLIQKPRSWGVPEVMVEETSKAGYVRLKAREDSRLLDYANPEGYIKPERLRNGWFYSLVVQAVNDFRNRCPHSDVRLDVRYHGPAVQIDIVERRTYGKLLSVDLVPCFETGTAEYFVPKSSSSLSCPHPELLWRQSFSMNEKYMLQGMDRDDHGCRHELLRIVKTIIKKERTSLGALESYHVKSAFVHYIVKRPHDWAGWDSLGKHFVEFLGELQLYLEKGNLPIFWQPGVNLLEDINPVVLDKMANRLKRILSSEAEMNNILGCRIRLPQVECASQDDWNYTSNFRMLENREGEMRNAPEASTFSVFQLVLALMKNVMACIVFVFKIVLAIAIGLAFLFFILVMIAIRIEEEKKRSTHRNGFQGGPINQNN